MEGNMIVIREPKTCYFDFDLPEDIDKNLKHEFEFITKHNESLAENKKQIKTRLNNQWSNISMEMIFINTENSKTNELHKFVLNLSQSLDLRNSNKHIALQNVSFYYTWKNVRKTV